MLIRLTAFTPFLKMNLTLYLFTTQSQLLGTLGKKPFENNVGKGQIAGYQHFLLFPKCFLLFPKQISIVWSHLFCRLQMLQVWTGLKLCCLVKG